MLSAKKKLLKKNRKLNLQDSPGCSTEILKFLTPSKTRNVLKRKAKSGTPIWKRIQLCRWKTKKSPKILQPKKESQLKSPDYTKGCSSSHATNTAQKSVTDNAKISSFVDLSDPKENSEAEENNKKIPSKINSGKNSYNSNCLDVSILRGNSNIKTTKESKEINELPILNTSNHKNDHISQLDLDENIELFRKIKPKKNKFRSLVKGGEYLPLSPNTNNHQKVDKSEFLEEILECSFDSNTSTESLMSSDNNTSLAPTFNENEPVVELTPPPKSKLISTGGFICVDRFKDTSELGCIFNKLSKFIKFFTSSSYFVYFCFS